MQTLNYDEIEKKFDPVTQRISITHIALFIILIANVIFFTENFYAIVVQLILAFIVFLHHIDDRRLKSAILLLLKNSHQVHNYEYTLTESNHNAIIAIDHTRKILTYNRRAEEIFGYTKEEMLGKDNLHLIMPEGYFKKHDKASAEFFKTKKSKGLLNNTHDLFGMRKNQETFPIRISFGVNDTNDIVIANISDITHEQEAKNEQLYLIHEIENTQTEIISTLGNSVESRDHSTKLHVDRVSLYCEKLAQLSGMDEEDIQNLKLASPLHDIGKITISDSILNKPAKLTLEEFTIMKNHTTAGYEILKNSKRKLLKLASIIAYEHHEKWDGTGYPRGLKAEEISLVGRITAIADVFDALATKRVYKEAWSDEKVKNVMQEGMGTHFDPTLLKIFLKNYNSFIDIRNTIKE
jgi:PAS domain S-box-containing protein